MPAGPAAPKIPVPKISPDEIISRIVQYITEERWKLYIFMILAIATAAYALWIIYEEYTKSPLKIRKLHWGKFKLSDIIRRK